MVFMISLEFNEFAMLYQTVCMLLIRFLYVDTFDVFTIIRNVHTRTLEGDGEKPLFFVTFRRVWRVSPPFGPVVLFLSCFSLAAWVALLQR